MPKVKQTARKEPERPSIAVGALTCFECGQEFTKNYNFQRHLARVHKCDEQGEPISVADSERYRKAARKGSPRESQEGSTSANVATPRPATGEPEPSTSGELPKRPGPRRAQKESIVDEPSPWPAPARGPERPLSPELTEAARQKVRRIKSAPPASEETLAVIRKPTRPAAPGSRQPRASVSAPSPPRKTPASAPSKRRTEMTPSTLAKKVAHRPNQSSREIADEVASTYAMPSTERRINENLVRSMRAAHREFCSRLRRALPLNRTRQDIDNFLATVERQCREAESHDSDEFV